jgi:hypothetical protein
MSCRVSADLRLYMQKQDEQYTKKELPDFRDLDACKSVTDPEMAVPISQLMEAAEQYRRTERREIREELAKDMLKAIAALERGLLQRWLDL